MVTAPRVGLEPKNHLPDTHGQSRTKPVNRGQKRLFSRGNVWSTAARRGHTDGGPDSPETALCGQNVVRDSQFWQQNRGAVGDLAVTGNGHRSNSEQADPVRRRDSPPDDIADTCRRSRFFDGRCYLCGQPIDGGIFCHAHSWAARGRRR